jgi:hypothetical protein
MDIWVGVDLGQLTDHTAAAVVRRSLALDPITGWPERSHTGHLLYRHDVLAIKRYPLGTPYRTIVGHIVGQLQRPEMGRNPRLVLDSTGVGVAITEMFRTALARLPSVECHAVTITAGRNWSVVAPRTYHVAKLELVGSIREALESQRLKVPPQLEHAETLKRELGDFRVKISEAGNELFSAREGAHDDLVLSVSLPIWLAGMRWMEMYVDPEWLLPCERVAVTEEQAAIEKDEVEALELEAKKQFKPLTEALVHQAHREGWSPDDPRLAHLWLSPEGQ